MNKLEMNISNKDFRKIIQKVHEKIKREWRGKFKPKWKNYGIAPSLGKWCSAPDQLESTSLGMRPLPRRLWLVTANREEFLSKWTRHQTTVLDTCNLNTIQNVQTSNFAIPDHLTTSNTINLSSKNFLNIVTTYIYKIYQNQSSLYFQNQFSIKTMQNLKHMY